MEHIFYKDLDSSLNQIHKQISDHIAETKAEIDDEMRGSKQAAIDDRWTNTRRAIIKKVDGKLKDFVDKFGEEHKADIRNKNDYFPIGWMESDKKIPLVLEKYRICDVLNVLEKHVRYNKRTGQHGSDLKYKGKHEYGVFITDPEFYEKILPRLNKGREKMGEDSLKKYLAGLRRAGAIVEISREGTHGSQPVYALGYFTPRRFVPFLTAKNIQQLRDFRL